MDKKKILEILKEAKEVYRARYYKGEDPGMCGCIYQAMLTSGIQSAYSTILYHVIPEFNYEYARDKFSADMTAYGYWWSRECSLYRLRYFNHLIELYSNEK